MRGLEPHCVPPTATMEVLSYRIGHTGFEPVMTESKSATLPLGECPLCSGQRVPSADYEGVLANEPMLKSCMKSEFIIVN